jgi:DNA polymerase IV (archaeal DinB-like DNA polymerase)
MERGEKPATEPGGWLPDVAGSDRTDRIVCHVDMDCFYAACERRREPALRDEPLVVGMGYEPGTDRGAVATASYEARTLGIESAQAISVALEELPNREEHVLTDTGDDAEAYHGETGFYRPVDMTYYQSVSEQVRQILHDAADIVREVSIDEAYLDVTDRVGWDGTGNRPTAEAFARDLTDRIAREAGVPASIGVAPNMSAAKIASDHDKPDGLVVVPPGEVRAFLDPLPVEAVHGVGPVRARTLRELGVTTAGELATADPDVLGERFGERGRDLYERARGVDDRPVTPKGNPKSLNRESAFAGATDDAGRCREVIGGLASEVAARATNESALYRTIGIKVVSPPFEISTRARSLSGPVRDASVLKRVALDLFEEFEGTRLRKLGVRVSNLEFNGADQSSLGNWKGSRTDDFEDRESTGEADRTPENPISAGQASLADFER